MKNFLKLFIGTLVFTQFSFCQNYDANLISKNTELNFMETKIRGIEIDEIIYYVEKDLQTLSAYKNNKLKWQTNIISFCGKPTVGKSEIRYLKFKTNKLFIVFGKHSFAEVEIVDGKTKFIGSD